MIENLKRMTNGAVNHIITGSDLFHIYKEIHRELEELSADQFAEFQRHEFAIARGMFARLCNPNRHECITGKKVIAAAARLRPVLNHYIGPKVPTLRTTNHLTINNISGDSHMGDKINIGGNVIGSAVGSKASIKAYDIVTQIEHSGILGEDVRQGFAKAAEALAALMNVTEDDKEDVADDMKKLKDELEKPAKEEGRMQKIWTRIKGTAPTVASILASSTSLGKIIGVVP